MLSQKTEQIVGSIVDIMFVVSELMERFYDERNHSYNTKLAYNTSVQHFEKVTNMKIDDMIHIAKE